jgi:hypothetical protein
MQKCLRKQQNLCLGPRERSCIWKLRMRRRHPASSMHAEAACARASPCMQRGETRMIQICLFWDESPRVHAHRSALRSGRVHSRCEPHSGIGCWTGIHYHGIPCATFLVYRDTENPRLPQQTTRMVCMTEQEAIVGFHPASVDESRASAGSKAAA